MTGKENYLKTLRREKPEWVPYYRDACQWVMPGFVMQHMASEDMRDWFGVPWTMNESGPMVLTGNYVMDDVTKWKQYIHLPDLDSLNWDTMSQADLSVVDRENKAVGLLTMLTSGGCFFIPLMNMMGFEEGLCALVEEPDAVSEMFEYLCCYLEKIIDYGAKYYKPEVMIIADDICAATGPMISMETYQRLLRPYYKRLLDRIHSYGVFAEVHMCGKGEDFVRDFVRLGADIWEPAQAINNLAELKKELGDKLIFNGGWASDGPGGIPGANETTVRESARLAIDTCGKDGGFVFWDGDAVGASEDMLTKIGWLADEVRAYGKTYYR